MDPPIDNADPVEEANEALKIGLRRLSRKDWVAEFKLLGRPSNEFVRVLAWAALQRIQELELEVEVASQASPAKRSPPTMKKVV